VNSGVDYFCLCELINWKYNINSYRSNYQKDQIFLVAYESLKKQPLIVLKNLANWLGIKVSDDILCKANSNMEFTNLQKQEAHNPVSQKEYFFRKGIINSGEEELLSSTSTIIKSSTRFLISNLNLMEQKQYKRNKIQ
jgi:hypothetical protein